MLIPQIKGIGGAGGTGKPTTMPARIQFYANYCQYVEVSYAGQFS